LGKRGVHGDVHVLLALDSLIPDLYLVPDPFTELRVLAGGDNVTEPLLRHLGQLLNVRQIAPNNWMSVQEGLHVLDGEAFIRWDTDVVYFRALDDYRETS